MGRENNDENLDPCTGFPTTHKAKLSIPNISWIRYSRSGSIPRDASSSLNESTFKKKLSDLALSNYDGKDAYQRYYGLLFAILSSFMFSVNSLAQALFPSQVHHFNLGIFKFVLMTLFSGMTITFEVFAKKNSDIFEQITSGRNSNILVFLLIRAVTGVFNTILVFYAIKYVTLADIITIDAMSPILIFLLAFLFFGEKFDVALMITAVILVTGTALMQQPRLLVNYFEIELDKNILIGLTLSFLEMMCAAGVVISLKFLENVHHAVIHFSFGFLGTLQCATVAWISGVIDITIASSDIFWILSSGLIFYSGQTFLTLALQYENVGPVGLLGIMEVGFVFIWQLWLGMAVNPFNLLGLVFIIIGGALVMYKKWAGSKESGNY